MGLDNGIMLKIKDKEKFGKMPAWVMHHFYDEDDTYELMYWRKCWNIRDVIFTILHENGVKTCEDCSFDMYFNLSVFEEICEKLTNCYTKQWWNSHDDSIWSWDDIYESGIQQSTLFAAIKLIGWLETRDPASYDIYFYDSY